MRADAQLRAAIAEFDPAIATLGRAALAALRRRLPRAYQLVYDNYNALAIGFGPTDRASDAILSLAFYPRRVSLCFLQAGTSRLPDPHRLLQGTGKLNRFIPLASAATLAEPAVRDLIDQALANARVPITPAVAGHLIIKSVSARRRPRRPSRPKGG
jgi:hypothetical protein